MYEAPGGDISFADIFAANWFYDAYLRRDAVPLVEFSVKGGRGWRAAAPSHHRDIVFGHGQQRQAILLADDCEVETILRRGGRSRLVFAAIERLPAGHTQAQTALETRSFRRFPLPASEGFGGGVVEFQQLFAMAVDGVKPAGDPDPRIVRLDADARLAFEMRWNAYATRRGPLTHVDNAEKFARLIAAGGDPALLERLKTGDLSPSDDVLEIARFVAEALGAAWETEGAVMNRIAIAYESGDPADPVKGDLIEALKALGARAQRAAAAIEHLGDIEHLTAEA